MQHIILLGSTGTIGQKVLETVSKFPEKFKIIGLAADTNHNLLLKQAKVFKPDILCINSDCGYKVLKQSLGPQVRVVSGNEGLIETASNPRANTLVSAVVGNVGLAPVIAAVKSKKTVKLANKEPLVSAGKIITELARQHKVKIIPIDSEHSAIFQCLQGEDPKTVRRIILTASGGPFFRTRPEELSKVTKKDALAHPNWSMGGKITIDSATMMNKGLEVIEARWLFDMDFEKIDVVIHPQSAVHGLVEFTDLSLKAQIGIPDMAIPVQYAMNYPERICQDNNNLRFDIFKFSSLEFYKPDNTKFPLLKTAYDCGKLGGLYPAVMNAANEAAVKLFLEDKIIFTDISRLVMETLESYDDSKWCFCLDSVYKVDEWARNCCMELFLKSL